MKSKKIKLKFIKIDIIKDKEKNNLNDLTIANNAFNFLKKYFKNNQNFILFLETGMKYCISIFSLLK